MRKILFVAILSLFVISTAWGQATNFNIDGRPTGDWFSGNSRDIPLAWMRAVDPMIAAGAGNPGRGNIYYVDSNVDNAGDGSSWANAKATLDGAVNVADPNSIIYVAQGWTEGMGDGVVVDIDVAGLTIVQVGDNTISNGADYTDYDTGSFVVGEDNITLVNMRFHANLPDVNDAISIETGSVGIMVIGCLFDMETAGTDEFHECISSDAAGNHLLKVIDCEFRMGAGAARSGIEFRDCDYAQIIGNKFSGDYAIADINNVTTASDHITISGNEIMNGTIGGTAGLNAQPCIELVATTSGVITGNILICDEATPDAAIVGADMYVFKNYYSETEGGVSSAPMWLTTDTLDNKIGIDDASNLGTTSNVTADSDGSILERLEDLSDRQLGTTLTPGKSYTVSAATASIIATTSPLFTIAGGPIRITDFFGVVTTEIGASNMTIQSVGTIGPTTFPFSDDVALDSDIVGTTYTFTGAVPSVLTPLVGAHNRSATPPLQWYAPVGTVDQLGDGAVAGVIVWYMTFVPLADGVTVVDAT